MNPFDPNDDPNIEGAIDQDDLIAFHLRELPRSQERALHRVLRTSPELQSESTAIASTLRAFPKHEDTLPLDAAALNRQWHSLRPSLPVYTSQIVPSPSVYPWTMAFRWALPVLVGSSLIATVIIASHNHSSSMHPETSLMTEIPSSIVFNQFGSSSTSTSIPSILSHPSRTTFPRIDYHFSPETSHPEVDGVHSDTAPLTPSPAFPAVVLAAPPSNASMTSTESRDLPHSTAAGQSSTSLISKMQQSSCIHHIHITDLTFAIIGDLTPDRSFTSSAGTGASSITASYTQETTPSVGALVSFHEQLRPWLGYRTSATYSEPTYQYIYQASNSGKVGNIINQHVYELSGTYSIQGPPQRRISTSAEFGGGLLAFVPANHNLTAERVSNAFRTAAVFGVSAEFAVTKHFALHAGYRALLYKLPTAYIPYGTTVPPAPSNLTVSNNPVVGITYRFGANGN